MSDSGGSGASDGSAGFGGSVGPDGSGGPDGSSGSGAGGGTGPVVGVDVVDLADPRCRGKSEDRRFAERVLAPAERDAVRSAPDPDLHLWLLWSGKEAAFKAVTRRTGSPPVFRHAAFVVTVEGEEDPPPARTLRGRWRWEGWSGALHWEVSEGRILALAGEGPRLPRDLRAGAARLETDDPGAFRHPPRSRCSSEARRHAAVEASRALGVESPRIRIHTPGEPAGRTPPRALLDGSPAPLEVSLSHHGRWVAWAVVPLHTSSP